MALTPTYASSSSVATGTTSVAVVGQAGIIKGDVLVIWVETNGTAAGTLTGWQKGTLTLGVRRQVPFWKIADGTESGKTFTISGLTSGTTSTGVMDRFSPSVPGNLLAVSRAAPLGIPDYGNSVAGSDTSVTTTAYSATATSSLSYDINDLVVCGYVVTSSTAVLSGFTSTALTRSTDFGTSTNRRNTVQSGGLFMIGLQTATVTAGDRQSPKMAGNGTGSATVGGVSHFLAIREFPRPGKQLVAWGFDENTGTTTADASGNGNTATVGSNWTTGASGFGSAYAPPLTGGNDILTGYVTPPSNGFTVSFKVYLGTAPTVSATYFFQFLNAYLEGAIQAYYDVSGGLFTVQCNRVDGSSQIVCNAIPFTTGAWHDVAIVLNGSEYLAYLDAASGLATQVGFNPTDGSFNNGPTPMKFEFGSSTDGLDLRIDNFRFYDYPLNPTQLATLATIPIGTTADPFAAPSAPTIGSTGAPGINLAGNSCSPTTPTGITASGQLEIAYINAFYNESGTAPTDACVNLPAGWAIGYSAPYLANSQYTYEAFAYHYSTGAETAGATVAWSFATVGGTACTISEVIIARVAGYTGTSGNPWVDTIQSSQAIASTATISSFTPGGPNSLLVAAGLILPYFLPLMPGGFVIDSQIDANLVTLAHGVQSSATATGPLDFSGDGSSHFTTGFIGTIRNPSGSSASGSITLGGSATSKAPITAAGSIAFSSSATAASSGSAATATGALSLGSTAAAAAPITASGSVTLGATANWIAQPASGSITLAGSANAKAPITASGSVTLGSSANAGIGATASGSISISGTASSAAPVSASGSITLASTATAAGIAPATATGSLALSGTATSSAPITASGSITLGSSASYSPPASGSITLGGSASAKAPVTATGSVTLSGLANAAVSITASGSVTLGGTAQWTSPPASGSITLAGAATGQAPITASGSIALGGAANASAPVTASGSITLAGAGLAANSTGAAGSIVLGGNVTASGTSPITASGSVSLAGAVTAKGAGTGIAGAVSLAATASASGGSSSSASGSITLGSTGTASASTSASGSVTLGGAATVSTPVVASGLISLAGAASSIAPVTASGSITFSSTANWLPPGSSGSITLGGSATTKVPFTASGSVTLGSTAITGNTSSASGSLTLGGIASAANASTASGSISLSGTVSALASVVASGSIALVGSLSAAAKVSASGSITINATTTAKVAITAFGSIQLFFVSLTDIKPTGAVSGHIDLFGLSTAIGFAVEDLYMTGGISEDLYIIDGGNLNLVEVDTI